jgi:hypothetical protein
MQAEINETIKYYADILNYLCKTITSRRVKSNRINSIYFSLFIISITIRILGTNFRFLNTFHFFRKPYLEINYKY